MAALTMSEMVQDAIDLLPPVGQNMVFDDYKAKLYESNPSNGRDVFTYLIKRDLIGKALVAGKDGSIQLVVSRLS